jgi:hypothetical protein
MKVFEVRLVQRLRIVFDDDRATRKSAEHVALECWGARTLTGDVIQSKTLGRVETRLAEAKIDGIMEVEA